LPIICPTARNGKQSPFTHEAPIEGTVGFALIKLKTGASSVGLPSTKKKSWVRLSGIRIALDRGLSSWGFQRLLAALMSCHSNMKVLFRFSTSANFTVKLFPRSVGTAPRYEGSPLCE
jgi:hypothetical protein